MSLIPENKELAYILNSTLWNYCHVPAYASVSLLTVIAFANRVHQVTRLWVVAFVFAALLGFILEILQSKVGRSPSFRDMFMNFVGIGIGLIISLVFSEIRSAIRLGCCK
jgi:VanZ family protein